MKAVSVQELEKSFQDFAEQSSQFSQQITRASLPAERDRKSVDANLKVAKTIFGKWSVEILAVLYNGGPVGFGELRKNLGISSRVLSQKLKMMDTTGLVERTVINSRPVGVRYSLTEKGLTVARIGEPIFLYLRFKEDVGKRTSRPERELLTRAGASSF